MLTIKPEKNSDIKTKEYVETQKEREQTITEDPDVFLPLLKKEAEAKKAMQKAYTKSEDLLDELRKISG